MKRLGLAVLAGGLALGCGAAGQGVSHPTQGDEAAMNGAPEIGAGSRVSKRPMTFADLMAMKRVSDPQVSPSGKWVLFSVTDVDLGKNTKVNHLWVVPLEGGGGNPPKQSLDGAPEGSGKNYRDSSATPQMG